MESLEYRLQKHEPGVLLVDAAGVIQAVNPAAQRLLGRYVAQLCGTNIFDLHPARSGRRIRWFMDEAREAGQEAPTEEALPATMLINLPDRVLLLTMSRLLLGNERPAQLSVLLHDLTALGEGQQRRSPPAQAEASAPAGPRCEALPPLVKLPVQAGDTVRLLDLADVYHLQAEGHYTRIHTRDRSYLANFALSALEARLDPQRFTRVHRSHLVALRQVVRIDRQGERAWLVLAERKGDGSGAGEPVPGEMRVPIGRSRLKPVRALLGLN